MFLEVARRLLLEGGYQGLTIGRVAEETGFSKGTIYQRFGSKEGLVVALGIRCREHLLSVIERGAAFDGRPRERLAALGEAVMDYGRLYPHDMRILRMIEAEPILERVPEAQQSEMNAYDVRIFETLVGIAQEAVAAGDLVLNDGCTTAGICFAFWVMVDGAFAASMGGAPLKEAGIPDPMAEVVRSGHYLLDGYGWRPLSTEWDYAETARRVRATVFAEEVANVQHVARRAASS